MLFCSGVSSPEALNRPQPCRARWRGTEVSIRLSCSRGGCADEFQVLVDGKEAAVLRLEKGKELYRLASGLPEGEHHVEVSYQLPVCGASIFKY